MNLKQIFQVLFIIPLTTAVDITTHPDTNAKLKAAATTLDRHAMMSTSDWIYNFNNMKPAQGDAFEPGSVKNANAATFPALTGLGMSLAQLNLGPCAMLPPHLHPRATNLVLAVAGNTTTWMWNENGVKLIKADLVPGLMTVFPMGSLHAMQNNGCDNAYLVSALDSDDPGTTNILNGLWSMPKDIVHAAFGHNPNMDVQNLGGPIPLIGTGSVMGSAECMSRCGIKAQH